MAEQTEPSDQKRILDRYAVEIERLAHVAKIRQEELDATADELALLKVSLAPCVGGALRSLGTGEEEARQATATSVFANLIEAYEKAKAQRDILTVALREARIVGHLTERGACALFLANKPCDCGTSEHNAQINAAFQKAGIELWEYIK